MLLIITNAYAEFYSQDENGDLIWDSIWDERLILRSDIITTTPLLPSPEPTPTINPIETERNKIVDYSKQYLGVPYLWGGTTPNGFDCSGLVQYVYRQAGYTISRTTDTQIHDGISVNSENITLGDIVFFGTNPNPHHVGIYIGNGEFIHAPQTGDVVKISNLSDRKDFCNIRRIIE